MDIEQQYDKLLRYCYMKLRDRALAEDLTQETFIKFFESKDYHSIGKEMAYLYTIARNLCIDYFRKHKDELIEDLPTKIQEMPESRDKVEYSKNHGYLPFCRSQKDIIGAGKAEKGDGKK